MVVAYRWSSRVNQHLFLAVGCHLQGLSLFPNNFLFAISEIAIIKKHFKDKDTLLVEPQACVSEGRGGCRFHPGVTTPTEHSLLFTSGGAQTAERPHIKPQTNMLLVLSGGPSADTRTVEAIIQERTLQSCPHGT